MRRIITMREQVLAMPIYYHVTTPEALEKIRTEGITPQIGPRAQALGETDPATYLFPSREDMDNALGSWLGDEFDEDAPLHALEIDLPDGWAEDSSVDYEKISRQPIPWSRVKNVEDV